MRLFQCLATRASIAGFVIFLAGGPIAWKSKQNEPSLDEDERTGGESVYPSLIRQERQHTRGLGPKTSLTR
ncbi:hypothetical protein L249_7560 [Ophiocordyceps polyrhachis-furcata BCC 54312]|uniref:Uncharacterized protein n=1 Tax=Ophiocordyceps polyrhachis-furcata BCC 54312 TaxID=1330021 RepID=A0A367LAV3_9HYPO|nr:hypothetical protein L249_7560 [Ophiocordyceps polyrhachis-furcata BCC 54312]